ncbi:peptidoglycan DD-metalloendopeptidase family protein [Pedobacter sp. SYP-B3415]|uniref:peptidoglycan DD-metalloendopeptidase family protein n=1 Tax=Pedobacter sp. SYP-B3415 TaxID=2496641 RepID=UPI00101C7B75|nr:peptidoglycan DD-metalloendopeptidase family protein [Pedobacter sp. SYP-B3415]
MEHPLQPVLQKYQAQFAAVVPFNRQSDRIVPMDLTQSNESLDERTYTDTVRFSAWVEGRLATAQARYGVGGYNEHRNIYGRSRHFDNDEEPRRLHLGTDIWGAAGTPVFNFYEATVHSFADNNRNGDYGATIILRYELDGYVFHALYGHLSRASLTGLQKGDTVPAGKQIAALGVPEENGNWPPHLHFQLVVDMKDLEGDFPGVCRYSEREIYLTNSPDPQVILDAGF